jgi:transcriptional regulator with XRE-family HTH domain
MVASPTGRSGRRSSLAARLLVEVRQRCGLSQRELARRTGVSRTTVVEIEKGSRDPGLGTLQAILQAVGYDLDVRLTARDHHDVVLEATLAALSPQRRAELESNLDRFVEGLAAGLPTSRPLLGDGERRAG